MTTACLRSLLDLVLESENLGIELKIVISDDAFSKSIAESLKSLVEKTADAS